MWAIIVNAVKFSEIDSKGVVPPLLMENEDKAALVRSNSRYLTSFPLTLRFVK